ncbi:hypothetical protein VKT23_012804 [Stygiomarasmius scandens]|uniref:Uncharacterized protein n=1 Tax=Marasmiellus scandens TaxID=2682957 RepID=A0ABR1J6G9_9AGAR
MTIQVDSVHPSDSNLVRFLDCDHAPMNIAENLSPISSPLLAQAQKDGYIVLFFVDLKNNVNVIEFIKVPSVEAYLEGKKKPDEMWKMTTVVKLNAKLPAME